MAHACGIPEGQLRRVYDWYFHEDTLRQAITLVIRYHATLPLTPLLGSGHTSSSDGIRFGVASSALNARHLPRYFGMRRGLTLYSHVLYQGTQYWVDMVNCQLREATFVLDGLLYQDAPAITEHYTDTHGRVEHAGQLDVVEVVEGHRIAVRALRPPRLPLLAPLRRHGRPGALPGDQGCRLRRPQPRCPPVGPHPAHRRTVG